MAFVKCKYCDRYFDNKKEPYVLVSSRRYAHEVCHKKYLDSLTEQEKEEISFFKYVKNLFKEDYNYVVTKKLAKRYITENHYTYSGMEKTLKWFYEVQGNSTERSNGTIGIIPYCYTDARDYYYGLYLAKVANQEKDLTQYKKAKVKEIKIKSPKIKEKPIKLFDMEDSDIE